MRDFFFKKAQIFAFLSVFLTVSLYSYDPSFSENKNELPNELEDMKIQEKPGEKIDLSLGFTDESGAKVTLSEFFKEKHKPVFLTIVYYKCPSLCNFHLNGVSKVFKSMDWNVGKEFEFVAVSMDHRETPDLAKTKKEAYIQDYYKDTKSGKEKLNGWHFLTGDEANIKTLADSVGFKYRFNPKNNQWIHPAVAYIITPDGKISRYLHGIDFSPIDLKLSLIEAADGKIGSITDKLVLFCFQYDSEKNKYVLYAYNIMRLGGILTVLLVGGFLFSFWRSQSKNKKLNTGGF